MTTESMVVSEKEKTMNGQERVAAQRRLLQSPRPEAQAVLRVAHPALAKAEEALSVAEERFAKARDAAEVAEAEAQRIVDDVGAGKATARQAEDATRKAQTARSVLPGYTKAVADAGGALLEEREKAADALADSIRERREKLRKALPEIKVKDLQGLKSQDLALLAEADIRDLAGRAMLQGRDLGAPLSWPVPVSVDRAVASWKPAAGGAA